MTTPCTVIAEIGINHNGEFWKAQTMINSACTCGAQVVKFQCHIPSAEMIPNTIVPGNADEPIWDMMLRCSLSEYEERKLKRQAEALEMVYLSTPFSREAVDRLERMKVTMYKIGSGECNNYPLVKHIVSTGKKIILSTGMNPMATIDKTVEIIGDQLAAILHCVSKYPTPYQEVNLTRMLDLKKRYGKPVGLSDHSEGIYTALAAAALGATIVEKHFTANKKWPGPDNKISIGPAELTELIIGTRAIAAAMEKPNPAEEDPGAQTAIFAFESLVTIQAIKAGETLTRDNCWVKRPGTGIPAGLYEKLLGTAVKKDIAKDQVIKWEDLLENTQ
jgi:sialic acid synthase SpsE